MEVNVELIPQNLLFIHAFKSNAIDYEGDKSPPSLGNKAYTIIIAFLITF